MKSCKITAEYDIMKIARIGKIEWLFMSDKENTLLDMSIRNLRAKEAIELTLCRNVQRTKNPLRLRMGSVKLISVSL